MNLDERLQKDLSPDIYCLVHNKIVNLEQQCKKYKEVIDKAIKFLEEWGKEPDADMYMLMNEYKEFNELLDILKEVSK